MIKFREENTFVINIDEYIDRLKLVTEELKKLNIDFTRFSAICPTLEELKTDKIWCNSYSRLNPKKIKLYKNYLNGAMGCKMSHYNVIQIAKDKNLPYAIIFEDDVTIRKNKETAFNELKNIELDDWDIIYIGGSVRGEKYEKITEHIQRIQSSYSTMGYIINKRAYDIVCENFISQPIECDDVLKNLATNNKLKVYFCNILKHRGDDSCIRK
jgi:GR25 family glycosyltransferase involved in LPS biosynthesis